MRLKNCVELLYLHLMSRWEKTAPEDGKQGLLGDKPERNTQISRMVFLLKKIAAGNEEKTYQALSRYTYRDDGQSYVSKDSSWMIEPRQLDDHWFLEGCTSLVQKQDILQNLTKLGLSPTFAACADDFVACKSIEKYFPTEDELREMLAKIPDEDRISFS